MYRKETNLHKRDLLVLLEVGGGGLDMMLELLLLTQKRPTHAKETN